MPNTPVTKIELAGLICRAFSMYLFLWAVGDAFSLPEFIYSFMHYAGQQGAVSRANYWTYFYLLQIMFTVIKMAALLMAAGIFWRRGPRTLRIFLGSSVELEASTNPPE